MCLCSDLKGVGIADACRLLWNVFWLLYIGNILHIGGYIFAGLQIKTLHYTGVYRGMQENMGTTTSF